MGIEERFVREVVGEDSGVLGQWVGGWCLEGALRDCSRLLLKDEGGGGRKDWRVDLRLLLLLLAEECFKHEVGGVAAGHRCEGLAIRLIMYGRLAG